ncbi:MAG: ABC transporter permease [Anaerolineae bacterium]|nr:ABC transporter permease [Anaerolineae bacterium]
MTSATQERRRVGSLLQIVSANPTLGVYIVLGVMLVGCSLFVPGFATSENYINIMQRSVALALVAFGQTFVIVAGSLDLSVGQSISAIAVVTSLLMAGRVDMMLPISLVAVGAGMLVGLINGLIITRLKVNPFITTLGTSLIIQGFLFSGFDNFAGSIPREYEFLGYGTVGPIPVGVIFMMIVCALAFLLMRYTKFGFHLYGTGGNPEVARLSGVRTNRVMVIAHVLAGLGAALTAIFIVSRLRAGAPWVGQGMELDSISAVVVGGAPLSGGRGGVWGTLAGVLILSILSNIFNILNVGAFAQDVLRGAILIAVVAFYTFRSRR